VVSFSEVSRSVFEGILLTAEKERENIMFSLSLA
jgi:hypothetical protein